MNSSESNHPIEEKFVPYIEGVLKGGEATEIAQFLRSHPEYHPEIQKIKRSILSLRESFAKGEAPLVINHLPPDLLQCYLWDPDSLTSEELMRVRIALAQSDEVIEEFGLLEKLREELDESVPVTSVVEVPAMSTGLKGLLASEFAQKSATSSTKVTPLDSKAPKGGRIEAPVGAVEPGKITMDNEPSLIETWGSGPRAKYLAMAASFVLVVGLFIALGGEGSETPSLKSQDRVVVSEQLETRSGEVLASTSKVAQADEVIEQAQEELVASQLEAPTVIAEIKDPLVLGRRTRRLVDEKIAYEYKDGKLYVAEEDAIKAKLLVNEIEGSPEVIASTTPEELADLQELTTHLEPSSAEGEPAPATPPSREGSYEKRSFEPIYEAPRSNASVAATPPPSRRPTPSRQSKVAVAEPRPAVAPRPAAPSRPAATPVQAPAPAPVAVAPVARELPASAPVASSVPKPAPESITPAPVAVSAPPVAVSAPPEAVSAPPVAVSAPPVAVSAPPVAVSAPPVAVSAPPVAVSAPPEAVSAPPVAVSAPPVAVSAPAPIAKEGSAVGAGPGEIDLIRSQDVRAVKAPSSVAKASTKKESGVQEVFLKSKNEPKVTIDEETSKVRIEGIKKVKTTKLANKKPEGLSSSAFTSDEVKESESRVARAGSSLKQGQKYKKLQKKANDLSEKLIGTCEVKVKERPDGSLLLTVYPEKSLDDSDRESLRLLLREGLELSERDSIKIEQAQ